MKVGRLQSRLTFFFLIFSVSYCQITIPDLIAAMKNGSTYVNVHTEQNPNGEVRGQIVDIP